MPRRRLPDQETAEGLQLGHVHRGVGRPPKAESEDPRLPMPVGHVAEAADPQRATSETRTAQRIYSAYARNLVVEKGDVPRALAITLGFPPEYVWTDEELVRQHDKIKGSARAFNSVSEIIEHNDAGLPVRVAVLTQLMHSDVPAARIAAVRELTEIDETAKAARIGGTWESFVRTARAKAALAK